MVFQDAHACKKETPKQLECQVFGNKNNNEMKRKKEQNNMKITE